MVLTLTNLSVSKGKTKIITPPSDQNTGQQMGKFQDIEIKVNKVLQ
jgi:hypothetical protein